MVQHFLVVTSVFFFVPVVIRLFDFLSSLDNCVVDLVDNPLSLPGIALLEPLQEVLSVQTALVFVVRVVSYLLDIHVLRHLHF